MGPQLGIKVLHANSWENLVSMGQGERCDPKTSSIMDNNTMIHVLVRNGPELDVNIL